MELTRSGGQWQGKELARLHELHFQLPGVEFYVKMPGSAARENLDTLIWDIADQNQT